MAKDRSYLPERDPNKSPQEQGLFNKYTVTKNDGTFDPNAEYFILRLDKDPHAKPAILAYADSCEADYPLLAKDLRERYG